MVAIETARIGLQAWTLVGCMLESHSVAALHLSAVGKQWEMRVALLFILLSALVLSLQEEMMQKRLHLRQHLWMIAMG